MLRSVLLTGVALALLGLARLGFNAVALNGFGETTAGALNVALSLGMLASLPVSTAFGPTALRYMGQAIGQGRAARAAWIFRAMLGLTLACGLLVSVAMALWREPLAASRGVAPGLVAGGAGVALAYTLYLYARNVLYAVDRVGFYTWLELVSGLVFFAVVFVGWATGSPVLLLAAFGASYGFFAATGLFAERRWLRMPAGEGDRIAAGDLAGYSALMLVGTVASLAVRELVVLLAPDHADLGGAAHLALCLSLLTPLQMLPRMLRTVLFAHAAQLHGKGDRAALSRAVSESSHWLTVVNVPACGAALLLAAPIIALLGGEPSPEHVLTYRLLLLGVVAEVLATPAANALPGVGEVRAPAYSAVAGLGLAAATWWLLAGHGVVGLAWGFLVSSLVKSAVPMWIAWRGLGARLTHAPGRVVGLAALAAGGWIAEGALAAPLMVAFAYVVAAMVVLAPLLAELRELVARVRGR